MKLLQEIQILLMDVEAMVRNKFIETKKASPNMQILYKEVIDMINYLDTEPTIIANKTNLEVLNGINLFINRR